MIREGNDYKMNKQYKYEGNKWEDLITNNENDKLIEMIFLTVIIPLLQNGVALLKIEYSNSPTAKILQEHFSYELALTKLKSFSISHRLTLGLKEKNNHKQLESRLKKCILSEHMDDLVKRFDDKNSLKTNDEQPSFPFTNAFNAFKDRIEMGGRLAQNSKVTEFPNEDDSVFYFELNGSHKIELVHNITEILDSLRNTTTIQGPGKISDHKEPISNTVTFFRGHGDSSYIIQPSIDRGLREKENNVYEESIIENPNDFKDLNNHLDNLVKMQHYSVPTRLIDITKSLSSALYFSCSSNEKEYGELIVFTPEKVRSFHSDTISILASLPALTYKKQQKIYDAAHFFVMNNTLDPSALSKTDIANFNSANCTALKPLLHEISSEKPFTAEFDPFSLMCYQFVQPIKDNQRIIAQQGAFIVAPLNPHILLSNPYKGDAPLGSEQMNSFRLKDKHGHVLHFIISPKAKKDILEELAILGVNKISIYPELASIGDKWRDLT